MMSYLDLGIVEIHKALVEKRVTPLELAKEAIERAKSNKDNAFEYIAEEEAHAFASTLTDPVESNLLWGIPYALKDNYSTKGMPTTASSNILNGYKPVYDATIVKKLAERGCVMTGKTTLDELAMGGTGTTGHLGKTYNPWDPSHTRMVGGSSCGSAVAISAPIVPFAIGSDTGDSVRKPASFVGAVGLKPTWGRISRFGLFPFAPSMDHVAFFTRSVEDSAIVLEAISGEDKMDTTSSSRPVEDYLGESKADVSGKRVAVIKDIIDSVNNPDVKSSFEKVVKALRDGGAIVEEVAFGEQLLKAIYATYMVISCAEAGSNNANLDGIKFGPFHGGATYQEVMSNARTKGFSELIKRRFVIGSFALMAENRDELFICAQKARAKIVERANEILRDYDLFIAPAAPGSAPLFEGKSNKLSSEYLIADNFMAISNFGGFPSITIPMGYSEGLPLGVNINGRIFEEGLVLSAARSIEDRSGLSNLSVTNKKEVRL